MILLTTGHPYAYEMECVVRIFFPREKIQVLQEGDAFGPDTVTTALERQADGARCLSVRANLAGGFTGEDREVLLREAPAQDEEHALGRMLFHLLSRACGVRPLWGILTGVRPARLSRSMAEQGMDENTIRRVLADRYLVTPHKIDLCLAVARKESQLLARNSQDSFSLYISIPFCPSRCLYCSFVSHDIKGAAKLVPQYVGLLCQEIRHTGEIAARLGLRLQTVYMGGGTPTTLEPEQLAEIMTAVRDSFDLTHLLEYTVEAGRPDTITPEKLRTLREFGVGRVSINPQTMDDAILRTIGRDHTAAQIVDGFHMAREAGFDCINMDLIAGLPGESGRQYAATMDQVLALRPENITVHTLTVKRSSRLRQEDSVAAAQVDVAALLDQGSRRMVDAGYAPYYLYRQKGTVENLENTGYALPGTEGLYNVLIMEEVQTILAVGAGAVTKLYRPGERLQRIFNFKFPFEYHARFDQVLARKEEVEQFYITSPKE